MANQIIPAPTYPFIDSNGVLSTAWYSFFQSLANASFSTPSTFAPSTSGTVQSVSVTGTEGIVANVFAQTTTPAITLGVDPVEITANLNPFTSGLQGVAPASGGGSTHFLRADGSWATPPGATSGTVTSVSVTTAAGVSGSVTNPTTTPAITVSLGAITPTSVAASGALSGSNFSGSSSGTNTGDQTTVSGNAGTATALQNARTINGTSFNGTANITVTADASTLTNTTLAAAVVNSSLTSVGTLSSLTVTGNASVGDVNVTSATVPVNGAYLAAANMLGFATNTTYRGRIDASGRLLWGTTTALTGSSAFVPFFQIAGSTRDSATISAYGYSAVNGAWGKIQLAAADSNTIGTNTALANGDTIGEIAFSGADGTNLVLGVDVVAEVDGAVSAGVVPTRLTFFTNTAAGSNTRVLRMDKNLNVVVGTAAIATTATGGFLTIPTCAGAPSGVPATTFTNAAPMIYDTTNHKWWVYDAPATAWKGVVLT